MLRFLLAVAAAVSVAAQPRVDAVVNGASFEAGISRGSLVSIFGAKLSPSAMSATALPLPTKLENTTVQVGDLELAAPLYFVSANQINAQIPFEILGDAITLTVTTSEGKSAPVALSLTATAPGLFTGSGNGKGRVLALNRDFQPLDTARAGEPFILYATGLGPTDPPALSGSPGSAVEPFNRAVTAPEVFVGEFPAEVIFAGLAPGLAGVYQMNVVPQRIASDRVFIRSRGISSNTAEIGMQGGQNVANVSGSIEAIYPTGDPAEPPASYTPILMAARFSARMDILPTAGPFIIAAVSEGGASLIQVDPGNGRFDASVTVPTPPARNGDFSAAELTPIDLITCSRMSPGGSTVCFPFPGGSIPASRIPPGERTAANLFPFPNTNVSNSPTAPLRANFASVILSLNRFDDFENAGGVLYNEGGSAQFFRSNRALFSPLPNGLPSLGSCLVSTASVVGAILTMPVGLDAGPVLNLSGPKGVRQLPLRAPGSYSSQFSSNAAQVEYLQAGDYVVDNGTGGRDVGPFKATLKIPQPLNATIQRSANATMVTWTGGDPNGYVMIQGFSNSAVTRSSTSFVCTERVSARQFSIPAAVRLSMPQIPRQSAFGESIVVTAPVRAPLRATGLDVGGIYFME